jgi:arsenate reductase
VSKKRVLFLCTGNSARSQMTEGLVNHLLGNRWEAYSAGTAPTGYVHPLAMRAMAELGIDISAQHSKPVDTFRNTDFDLVITVCDDAARNCPVWLGKGKKVHLGLLDPAAATGSEAERLEVFRRVRDAIWQRIPACLEKERIADRVTNICERVVYMVTGRMEEMNVSRY